MELFKHQKDFLDQAPDKRLLCWDTGTGKTFTAIKWADGLDFKLVICPKALKENWRRNIENYSVTPELYTVLSKEEFKKVCKSLRIFGKVIVDEAHHFAGMKSALSKNLYWYLKKHNVPNVLFLTATPYRSSPWDIYILARHLGLNWNYMDFRSRYFEEKYVAYRRTVFVPREGVEKDIAELVKRFSDVVKLEDCVDVPEQTFETEFFALSSEQSAAKAVLTDINPIVRYTKNHEIENGFLMGDGYEENKDFECLKHDRLMELAESTPKIAIVARYNYQLDLIARVLGHLKRPIFIINGENKHRDRDIQEIDKLDKCIVLIQAACSEGYELPSIGLMVFASLDFSYVNYKQMCGRILRINKLKKNVYLHLVSSGIDAEVHKAVMKKQDFDMSIYARNN